MLPYEYVLYGTYSANSPFHRPPKRVGDGKLIYRYSEGCYVTPTGEGQILVVDDEIFLAEKSQGHTHQELIEPTYWLPRVGQAGIHRMPNEDLWDIAGNIQRRRARRAGKISSREGELCFSAPNRSKEHHSVSVFVLPRTRRRRVYPHTGNTLTQEEGTNVDSILLSKTTSVKARFA